MGEVEEERWISECVDGGTGKIRAGGGLRWMRWIVEVERSNLVEGVNEGSI